MSDLNFPRQTFKTSRDLSYSYIYLPSSSSTTPSILFLHGFPSIAADFHNQITHFSALGYGVIAPDLIGYGSSSRPANADDYKHKRVVQDLVELLDAHAIQKVIGISHDFGAQILTRLEFYHPERVSKLVFLTIAPITIGQEFDLDAVNTMTSKMLGYEGFGYQDFLTRDDSATALLKEHSESFHDLVFTSEHELWKDHFGRIGGLKTWLLQDRRCRTIPGFSTDLRTLHQIFFSERGYEGAKYWYLGLTENLNIPDDQARLQELGLESYKLAVGKKVLLVTAGADVIAFPDVQAGMAQSYVSHPADLHVKQVNAGHWIGIERSKEVNMIIQRFLS